MIERVERLRIELAAPPLGRHANLAEYGEVEVLPAVRPHPVAARVPESTGGGRRDLRLVEPRRSRWVAHLRIVQEIEAQVCSGVTRVRQVAVDLKTVRLAR